MVITKNMGDNAYGMNALKKFKYQHQSQCWHSFVFEYDGNSIKKIPQEFWGIFFKKRFDLFVISISYVSIS
jgi:hypothetical protein